MSQQENPIADCSLVLVHASGQRTPGRIVVYPPRQFDDVEAQCRVLVEGLHDIGRPISGNDRLQSLLLALRLLAQLLSAFEEDGGKVEHPTGEPFDLEPYFGGPLKRGQAAP